MSEVSMTLRAAGASAVPIPAPRMPLWSASTAVYGVVALLVAGFALARAVDR